MRVFSGVVAILAAVSTLQGGPPEKADRERVLSELQTSRKQFLDAIANLSAAQWTFKAGPDRWSIAEVADERER